MEPAPRPAAAAAHPATTTLPSATPALLHVTSAHAPTLVATSPPDSFPTGQLPPDVEHALANVADLSEEQRELLRFPLSCGPLRPDMDARGQPATVVDCCFNSNIMSVAHHHRPLKLFLINMTLSWLKHKVSVLQWRVSMLQWRVGILQWKVGILQWRVTGPYEKEEEGALQ